MRTVLTFCVAFLVFWGCETPLEDKIASYQTPYEASKTLETATYEESIAFYKRLAKDFPEVNIQTLGSTDSGFPLHLVTFNPDGDFNFDNVREDKALVLVNNGIHPGESDGIDATMLLFRDLATEKLKAPKNTVLVTIPVYNIGGALNRNGTTRVNQNGPAEYGFRGNARNYDLNRDFVKMDTENALSFAEIFHLVKPDVFVDNHVSNGADYQYVLTHLFTQHNKLGGELGQYLEQQFQPQLEESLLKKDWDVTPYVNVYNRPPDQGFTQFLDNPRYSTGYTTLWNTLGFMVETHMLKPYAQRVEGTYEIMLSVLDVVENDFENIKKLRAEALARVMEQERYFLNWTVDTTQSKTLKFKGYEALLPLSEITGLPQLKYDRNQPFEKEVRFQHQYYPLDTIAVPKAYVFSKSWKDITARLDANNIAYQTLEQDTTLFLESYRIDSYETYARPYEGHYPHYNTQVTSHMDSVRFMAGDILVPTQQEGIRYLLETLEPESVDSFFNWNFFDTILQRKEGFSPYVFEELALRILQKDTILRNQFLEKKALDEDFSQNAYAQLNWVFSRSKYQEKAYLQYPIYRLNDGEVLSGLIAVE
ncbi:MAG: M14 family metallopeptidase [Bacteroidota bacterium]